MSADGDTRKPASPETKPGQENGRREFFFGLAWTTVFQILGTVIAGLILLAGGVVIGRQTKDTGPSWPSPEDVRFVVEDDVNGGVWSLTGPVAEELFPHEAKPPNAVRWLKKEDAVIVRCVRPGTGYRVEVNKEESTWHWYGRLRDETWIPLAALQETSKDGSQGVATC